MIKTVLISFLLLATTISVFGQKGTYLGFEAALNHDLYEFKDPCNLFSSTLLNSGSWGFTLGQEINKNLVLESGIIVKYYDTGYRFTSDVGEFAVVVSSSAFTAIQIPLRLQGRVKLIKNKLDLTGTLGYHFAFNSNYTPGVVGQGEGMYGVDGDTIRISTVYKPLDKNFSLFEAGIGLDILSGPNLVISISSSYYLGFNPVYQMEFETEGTNCVSDGATGTSNGSYWNVGFGLKYRISSFWGKAD